MTDPTIVGWQISLKGDRIDLAAIEQLFKGAAGASLAVRRRDDGTSEYFLCSPDFEGVQDPEEIGARAAALLSRMNGVMKVFEGAELVSLGEVWGVRADGSRVGFIGGHLRGRSRMYAVLTKQGEPPPIPDVQRWFALSDADNDVADALEHFARSDDWFDFYKTLEILQDALGGREVIWQRGWATREEVNNLAKTANFYRHARADRPDHPLTTEQARELLRKALGEWLRAKAVR